METPRDTPHASFQHMDDVGFREVKSQLHGDRRVSVWIRFLVNTPERSIFHTRYDPGMTLERHGHASDHYVFVISGDVRFGDERCGPGTLIELPFGASFGPIETGAHGAEIFEVYFGPSTPVPTDPAEYLALLATKGITRVPPPADQAANRVDT